MAVEARCAALRNLPSAGRDWRVNVTTADVAWQVGHRRGCTEETGEMDARQRSMRQEITRSRPVSTPRKVLRERPGSKAYVVIGES
jgi:hypothetical protein